MDTLYPLPTETAPFDQAIATAATRLGDSVFTGLSFGVSEALADPIVQALMAADGVDPAELKAMMRRMAGRISGCRPAAEPCFPW